VHAASLVFLCSFGPAPLSAGASLRGQGKNLFWRDGKVALRASRTVHLPEGASTGVDPRERASEVHAAVFQAIRAWTRTGKARVELDLAFTDAQTLAAGENIVTFTDTAPFDTGLCSKERHLSCTVSTFGEDGAVQSSSVAFYPHKKLSALELDCAHDIGLLMMHEMGHVLGLDHSFVTDSVMLAEAELEPVAGAPRVFSVRELGEDDVNTLAALYPLTDSPLGRITGTATRNGAPVKGVRLLAVSTQGRIPFGAVSEEDSRYALHLPPGDYTVVADAPNGPGGKAGATGTVKVPAAGTETSGADVALPPVGVKLNVESVGVVQNGAYAGMPRVDLARGRDHNLALTRPPELGGVELILPEPAVLRLGNASSPASAPQLVRQNVRVAAQAPTGSYAFAVRAGLNFTVLAAPLRIVNNPRVESLCDFETLETVTVLRAGRRYVLAGSDLAGTAATAEAEFEDAPLAAQLGGVALRLGSRFAPLLSVKPNEIVFDAPPLFGDAAEVSLLVVAGSLMESAAVKLAVARE